MIALCFFGIFYGAECDAAVEVLQPKLIKLTEGNFVTLRGPINQRSASDFISTLSKIKEDNVYIYLMTPGGSIIDGNNIIDYMEAMTENGKKITCIADNAFSMGFVILQACPTRYVKKNSIIMQHQPSFGVGGPMEQVMSRLTLIKELEKQNNDMQASRLGLTQQEFHDLYEHDWWLYGSKIVENKASDAMVKVYCDMDVDKTTTIRLDTWFGPLDLEYSVCPLMHVLKNYTWVKQVNETNHATDIQKILNQYNPEYFVDYVKSVMTY